MRRLIFVILLSLPLNLWAQDRPLSPVVDRAILRAMAENAAGSLPASILPTPLMILAAAQPAVVTPLTPIANLRGRTDANGYLLVRVVIDDSGGGGACSLPTCTGTLGATQGGTGITTYTLGDTLYASAANTLAKLAGNITTTRKFLRQTGDGAISAAPAWDTIVAADVPASALTAANDTNVTLTLGGTPASSLLAAASITAGWTGTLAASRINASAVHSVVNDTNVTGSIAAQALTLGWTGSLAVARGGTGQTTFTDGQLLIGNTATGSLSKNTLTAGSNITVTNGNGTITIAAAVGNHNLLSATHPDTLAGTVVLGDLIFGNVTPAWARLAGNTTTTKNFLTQTGTGAVSAAPAWGTLASADLPTITLTSDVTGAASGGSVATTIANDAVTYAKMQNVSATDKVLGRSTAGAGDTEEITFSDAAQDQAQDTFADDQVWVADSATAGTPRTITNCTDTGGNHLNYTASTNSFSCGTTGSGSVTPSHIVTTEFVTAGKFTDISASGGSISFVNAGLQMTTGPAAGEKAGADWSTIGPAVIVNGSPTFSCRTTITTLGTDMIAYWGLGSPPVTGSFTTAHVGFKLTRASSGTANVFATQADGTTENASSALTAVVQGDKLELIAVVNGTTSADYYWRLNDGALSSATNLTTNLPTTSTGVERFYVSNAGIATTDVITVLNATYKR